MPRRYALSVLRTRCQRRADKENDTHIASAEWDALMSEAYGEIYDIVAGTGLRYFETVGTITADGSASYDEFDDHAMTVGLDRVESDGTRYSLRPLMTQDRTRYGGVTGQADEYAIIDDQIFLYPTPASGTYELIYIPQAPDLATYADGDLIDVVCNFGEAFFIWSTAVKALSKSESDVRLAMAERDRNAQRLMEWAIERDANEPRRRVIDDEYDRSMSGYGDPGSWSNRP